MKTKPIIKMKGLGQNSLSRKILCHLGEKTKMILSTTLEFTFDPYDFLKSAAYGGSSAAKIYYSYRSLVQNNYIEETKENLDGRRSVRIVYLTRKGCIELLREKIGRKLKLGWDGRWHLIIFDIPEGARQHRDFLRGRIKSLGFKELQKSVWIFPYDVREEFNEFLRLCNVRIEGDVRYAVIESMSFDADLKKHFNLWQ